MCGIAGIFSSGTVDPSVADAMTQSLRHRGPDANGIFISDDRHFALVHTRLSIIDLSACGNQPMFSHDRRYVIVFNGEIYNYRILRTELKEKHGYHFTSESDTEVILHGYDCWGADLPAKLSGMFAFVLLDQHKKELFICRDHIGKKPLFYYHDGTNFIFGSEIKALLKHPLLEKKRQKNYAALNTFLHLGYIPGPDTAYIHIKKFPAAHFATLDSKGQLTTRCYWDLNSVTTKKKWTPEGAIVALREKLFDAVGKRLISDVPLGAFLSGGTDSSIVVAIASKLKSEPLKTFTIGFDDVKFDESSYARKVAEHLKTDHHHFELKEKNALEILDQYLEHFDEPFADTSAIPTMLVSRLARREVTVALTGDGGDELFHGYGSYDWANRLDQPLVKLAKTPIGHGLSAFGNDRMKRVARLFEKVSDRQKRSHIFSQEQYFFTLREVNELLVMENSNDLFAYEDPSLKDMTPAEMQAIFDLQYYLKDDLLVKVDRASMFYGLECRCPLLDHDVVELALSMPPTLKRQAGEGKWILKKLLCDYLPHELVYRKKWGFGVPLGKWLRNDLRYLIDTLLTREVIEAAGIVRYENVNRLKKSFFDGADHLYNRIWVLIVLHKWLRENP